MRCAGDWKRHGLMDRRRWKTRYWDGRARHWNHERLAGNRYRYWDRHRRPRWSWNVDGWSGHWHWRTGRARDVYRHRDLDVMPWWPRHRHRHRHLHRRPRRSRDDVRWTRHGDGVAGHRDANRHGHPDGHTDGWARYSDVHRVGHRVGNRHWNGHPDGHGYLQKKKLCWQNPFGRPRGRLRRGARWQLWINDVGSRVE